MRIAVIGSGIAGLTTAYLLDRDHDVVVFEAQDHVGGHTRTVELESSGGTRRVDTGFVVFNEATYPGMLAFFRHLGVGWKDSDMSFSVACERTGLEYAGSSPATVFAQARNLVSPRFLGMLRDVLRFNGKARAMAAAMGSGRIDAADTPTLRSLIDEAGYGPAFVDHYLVPMGSAIWSTSPRRMLDFPAGLMLRFLDNHRLLTVNGHLTWKVVEGGSSTYVDAVCSRLEGEIRTGTPVTAVRRGPVNGGPVSAGPGSGGPGRGGPGDRMAGRDYSVGGVVITSRPAMGAPTRPSSAPPVAHGEPVTEIFDAVVLACHSDQALALLADPTPAESEILGALPFGRNEVVVHTDTSLLPDAPRARASWNYHVLPETPDRAVVTYDMTRLQGLAGPERFLVTLNRSEAVDPDRIRLRFTTSHPVFTLEGYGAQERHGEISGVGRTWFAGAYWRNGFHEDGVQSAFRVARSFGVEPAERLGAVGLGKLPDLRGYGPSDGSAPDRLARAGRAPHHRTFAGERP